MNLPNSYKIALAVVALFILIGVVIELTTPSEGGIWLSLSFLAIAIFVLYKANTRRPGR